MTFEIRPCVPKLFVTIIVIATVLDSNVRRRCEELKIIEQINLRIIKVINSIILAFKRLLYHESILYIL